jgi:hypothetical protein
MPVTTLTSTELHRSLFNSLSMAVQQGPVNITTHGRTTHVLVSFEEYCRLTGRDPEALASEIGQGFSPGIQAPKKKGL